MRHDSIKPYHTEATKTEEVARMFDNIAGNYDFLNRLFSLRIDVLWRKKLIKILNKQKPSKILDIATGTAELAIAASKGNNANIVGVDISKEMLEIGKQKIIEKKLSDRIVLEIGDAMQLNFNNGSFDAVTVAFGVRNFENLEQGLKEMLRVLSVGGKLYILEFSNPHNVIISWLYYFYFCNVLPMIGRWVSKDARAYTYLPESAKAFPSGDAMKQILLLNGYKDIQCIPLTFGISTIYIATR